MEPLKKLLYDHIKDLDYHSARESKNPFKWNTPLMNEFLAFGKLVREDAQQEIRKIRDEYALTDWGKKNRELEARLDAVRKQLDKLEDEANRWLDLSKAKIQPDYKRAYYRQKANDLLKVIGELRRQL